MPTDKKRLNITLSKNIEMVLQKTAKRDKIPVATKAIYLLELALETEEDVFWDKVASKRDTKNAKFISHNKVWV